VVLRARALTSENTATLLLIWGLSECLKLWLNGVRNVGDECMGVQRNDFKGRSKPGEHPPPSCSFEIISHFLFTDSV
jgi:hypothetical protein